MNQNNEKILPFEAVSSSVESLYARHLNKSRIIYLLLVLSLGSMMVALPYIKINISSQSRGIIRSQQQNNLINTVIHGQISELYLEDNKRVEKGALLLVLNTKKIDDKIAFQKAQMDKNKIFMEDLDQLILMEENEIPDLQSSLYNLTLYQYQKELGQQQLKLEQLQKQLDRSALLLESGSIAKAHYEDHLFERDLQQKTLESFIRQHKKAWESELQRYTAQNNELSASNRQLQVEKQQYYIKAPIAGTITQYSGIQVGNYISPAQEIAQISTTDSLLVECLLPPSDVGLLYEGMPVKFQIDAFNYNQWGLASGTIDMISKDVIMRENRPGFIVRCSLSDKHLALRNGYQGELKKGMTLNARFQITERTLYQLLYDKLDHWLNPKMNLPTSKS